MMRPHAFPWLSVKVVRMLSKQPVKSTFIHTVAHCQPEIAFSFKNLTEKPEASLFQLSRLEKLHWLPSSVVKR